MSRPRAKVRRSAKRRDRLLPVPPRSPSSPWLPRGLSRPLTSLRPYGFAVGWLLCFEVLLRVFCAPDGRVLKAPLPIYGCLADDEQQRLIAARAGALPPNALDIVLIGDSVLGSVNNAPGERLADYLGPALSDVLGGQRPVRVFSLAAGGAHASDVYGLLRRLLVRLEATPLQTRNLAVVLSSNVIFFSRRQSQPAMLAPCLLDGLPDADPLRRQLSLPAEPSPLERRTATWLAGHVYLYQQRRHLAEAWFGGAPRQALREGLQRGFKRSPTEEPPELRNRSWRLRGLSGEGYAPNYDFIPLSAREALNHRATEALAGWLGRQRQRQPELPVLVMLNPQNHALVGAHTSRPEYQALTTAIEACFHRQGVRYVSYDRDPDISSELFLDNDHLTAEGNRILAQKLAVELAASFKGLISVDNR